MAFWVMVAIGVGIGLLRLKFQGEDIRPLVALLAYIVPFIWLWTQYGFWIAFIVTTFVLVFIAIVIILTSQDTGKRDGRFLVCATLIVFFCVIFFVTFPQKNKYDKYGRPLTIAEQSFSGLDGTNIETCYESAECNHDKSRIICRVTVYSPPREFRLNQYGESSDICEYIERYGRNHFSVWVKDGTVYKVQGHSFYY